MINQARSLKIRSGFTLIELLVVLGVIAILIAVLVVALYDFQARSRDTRRMADIKALQDALAMYQIRNAAYPLGEQTEPLVITGADALSQVLVGEKVISGAVKDPISALKGAVNYVYTYQPVDEGASYLIKYCLETDTIRGRQQGCVNEAAP